MIKIKSLRVDKSVERSLERGYLYKDLALDLRQDVAYNPQLNRSESLRDLQALYDIEAVKNSIKNCFLTAPGQKILSPEFGIDLRRHLFEPVDEYTSEVIQDDILDELPKMEPRINVRDVTVVADEEEQVYSITLRIDVPSLDVYGLSIKSELNSVGYSIL